MQIRRANASDIPALGRLLVEVCDVHAEGRPDLFVAGGRKYGDEELEEILQDPSRPILVCEEEGQILGHAFCEIRDAASPSLRHPRELYLDDLCVAGTARGRGVGTALWHAVEELARDAGCYRATLHVWQSNPQALAFYEHLGLGTYLLGMEKIL